MPGHPGTMDGPLRAKAFKTPTLQVGMAGWRCDIRRWCDPWYNEFGVYGQLQWTSYEVVDGVTILYGFVHERKKEGDDPTEWLAKCKLLDQDNFKYTIYGQEKGTLEIVAKRIRTGKELDKILEAQAETAKSFAELADLK